MYYGQFDRPKVDEYIHKRFFSHNPKSLICIEAGAEDGISIPTCKFFEESLNWSCINIEPDINLFNTLTKHRINSININKALVSPELSNKKIQFQPYSIGIGYVVEEVLEAHIDFINKIAGQEHTKGDPVNIIGISYNDLITQLRIRSVALLVLDTEGSELNILKSLNSTTVLPSVLCVEDNLGEQAKFDSLLLPLGYKFDSKVYVNLHYYLG